MELNYKINKIMNKFKTFFKDYGFLFGFVLVAVFVVLGGAQVADAGGNAIKTTASSTAYTISQTSVRLVATSSPRSALLVQSTNCTQGGTLYMNIEGKDAAAVVNDGVAVLASTTLAMGDKISPPTPQDSVRAIVNSGSCVVLVTEFIDQF